MPLETKRNRSSVGRIPASLAMVLVIVAGPLVGVVHTPVVIGVFVAAALILVVSVVGRWRRKQSYAVEPLFMLPFLAGAILAVFRLVPLPDGLRALLTPTLYDRTTWMLETLPEVAQAAQLSMLTPDPGATAAAALRLLTALFVGVVVANGCARRDTRLLVSRLFVVAGAVLFTVSVAHKLAHAPLIWGLFRPTGSTPIFGPLVNPNQLARAFGVFAIWSIGHALTNEERADRIGGALVGAMCTVGLFLALSRGAVVAFFAASLFGALMLWRLGRIQKDASPAARIVSILALPAAALLGLVATAYLAQSDVVSEITITQTETLESSKAALYAPAGRLLLETGGFGVGVGGFETTYPAFVHIGELRNRTYSHVENVVLQTLVDHGFIIGTLFLLLALWIAWRWVSRVRRRSDVVPLAAMVFLVFGDLFDFVLEIGFGALVAAVIMGYASGKSLASRTGRFTLRMPAVLGATVLAVVAGLVIIPLAQAESRSVHKARLVRDAVHADLEHALARRPLDGYIAYRLAVNARQRNDARDALRWANRAMVVWPNLGSAHVEAARALVGIGQREQAFLEYRVAAETRSLNQRKIHQEVARVARSIEDLDRGLSDDRKAWETACREIKDKNRLALAQLCFDGAAQRFPEGPAARESIALALARGDPSAAQERYNQFFGERTDGHALALRARLIERQVDTAEAYAQALTWTETRPYAPLLEWRMQASLQLKRYSDTLRVVERLRPLTGDARVIDNLDRAQMKALLSLDAPGQALKVAERLARRRPKDVTVTYQLAHLENRLGLHARAAATVRRLLQLAPTDERSLRLAEAIQAALEKKRLQNSSTRSILP